MAAPQASNDPQAQRHYVAQFALLLALRRAIKALWPSLDLSNLKTSQDVYATKAAALVRQYAAANIGISADYFDEARAHAGAPGTFTVPHVDPPTDQEILDSVRGALAPLWTPASEGKDYGDLIDSAQGRVEANTEKIAADAGRNELIQAIEGDRYARGFARVARPDACSFCLLLATRGAVYKTAAEAGQVDASSIWPDAKGFVNRYHVNCHCTVQPLFGTHYEAPAHVRAAEALYVQSTATVHGSRQKQAAFRKALAAQRNPTTSVA